jgi:PPOX class probable FMN-dependent enzyme
LTLTRITTLEDLKDLYPAPVAGALRKVAHHLTPLYRQWIEQARFCILSTVGPGGVHGSPRGDDGPVVRVADPQTLHIPDWRGNNRLDCLRDIVEDGRAALIFMIRGTNTTVRVNGRAWLSADPQLCQSFEQRGKHPTTVIVFDVAEVYTQCAKALMRSGLWDSELPADLPTVGQILADMTDGEHGGAEYDRTYAEYAKPRMW